MMAQRVLQCALARNIKGHRYGTVACISAAEMLPLQPIPASTNTNATAFTSRRFQSRPSYETRSNYFVMPARTSLPMRGYVHSYRAFSSSAVPSPPQSPLTQAQQQGNPPPALNEEIALGVQDATQLFIKHGLGKQALTRLGQRATPEGDTSTLVPRWQEMLQAYLGCQLHVLGGMGYAPDERGIGMYNSQLASLMSTADPDTQEKLRISSRDTWRTVLTLAFNLTKDELTDRKELTIADARDIMYKISQQIMSPPVLEKVAQEINNLETGKMSKQEEIASKHTVVQKILIADVYCGKSDGSKSIVEETRFGEGERGYIKLQSAMAEYQSDPLVAQYMGGAMMHILRAAGLEEATREMAESMQSQK